MMECGIETRGELTRVGVDGGVRAPQTAVESDVEERGAHAIGGEGVLQSAWSTADDAVQPKSAEIVSHRAGAVAAQIAAKEGSDQWTHVAVTEASGQMTELAQSSEQRLRTRIAEAQRGDALAGR